MESYAIDPMRRRKNARKASVFHRAAALLMTFGLLLTLPAANADAIKISPLGDSITHGGNGRLSYRSSLWHKLQQDGDDVDFVGSMTAFYDNNPSTSNQDFDIDHEGHWGWEVSEIANNIDNWLVGYTPDIAIIHLGTNDFYRGQSNASTLVELSEVFDSLRIDNPQVTILIAETIPMRNLDTSSLNAEIRSWAPAQSTALSSVIVVDQYTGYDAVADSYDNFHPNTVGEEKMATRWYNALKTPALSAPAQASKLDTNETFHWQPILADVTEWWLYLGSQKGAADHYNSGSLPSTTLQASISGLPSDGNAVYSKLWYRVNGDSAWKFIEHSFVSDDLRPEINSPAIGTQLSGSMQVFDWTDNVMATDYWLDAGSSVGASDFFRSGSLGNANSITATGLPSDGVTQVYVRLWYRVGTGAWHYVDETYTAGSLANRPDIVSHTPTGSFADPQGVEVFSWSENGSGATEYWVFAGPAQGDASYFNSGNVGNVLTTTVTGLPTNGSSVWVRLWYRGASSGAWLFIDEEYTATGTGPTINASGANGILAGIDETFNLIDPNNNVTSWWLYIGSSIGASNYEDSGNLDGATSYTTTNSNLPIGSVPVHVRLWYRTGTITWQSIDKIFDSAP